MGRSTKPIRPTGNALRSEKRDRLKTFKISKEGDFSKINAMEGTKTYIFMIDKSGNLYKVDKDGTKTLLGDDYGDTRILTTLDGRLWTVEGGNLYKTS